MKDQAAQTAGLEQHCGGKFVMRQEQKQACGFPPYAESIEESDVSLSERDLGPWAVGSSPGRIRDYGYRTWRNLGLQP